MPGRNQAGGATFSVVRIPQGVSEDDAAEEFVIADAAGHTMIDVEALRLAEQHGADAEPDDDRDERR